MKRIRFRLPSVLNVRRKSVKTVIFGKNLRKLKILTLAILLTNIIIAPLASLNPVKADNFYPSQESMECQLIGLYGMQYNSIGGNGVQWNAGDVSGVSGSWIQNHHFTDVGTPWYPSAHRYSGVADFVSVPPNTQVDIGVFMFNYSGHGIHVNRLDLWTARSNPSNGDWTRLGSGGTNTTRSFLLNGTWRSRTSKAVAVGWNGSYGNYVDNNGQVFYSFNTIQPIQLQSFTNTAEWDGANLRIRYDMTIRNVSSYALNNINITDVLPDGTTYNQNHNFSAGQTRTITYYADMGTSYPYTITNDPATIRDPNSHTEIVTVRQANDLDRNPEALPGLFNRNDSPDPNWYANQPVWGETGSDWGVRLIPYWFNSGSVSLQIHPEIGHEKMVRDGDEDWSEDNSITPSWDNPGENEFDYRVRVWNDGAGTSNGVRIIDDYDQSLIEILDADGGTDNGNTIVWDGFDLAHGEERTFNVRARVIMPLPHGVHVALNTIDTEVISPPPGTVVPPQDDTETTITTEASLDIEKYVVNETARDEGRNNSGDNVDHPEYGADADVWYNNNSDVITVAGDELLYTLVYRNTGNANSPDTFVADHLPRYILDENGNQYEIIRAEDFIEVEDGITPVANGGGWDIVWSIGELQVGETWAVKQFRVRINPSSEITLSLDDTQRLIDNVSEIYSSDQTVVPDTDNAIIRVDQPNALITKESDKLIYQSNEEVVYAITVTNNGSSTAIGTMTDTLPEGMHYISSSPEADRVNGRVLEWDLTLEAGETIEVYVNAGFDIPVQDQEYFDNNVVYDYEDINENERPNVQDNAEVQVLAPVVEVEKERIESDVVTPLNTIQYIVRMRNVGSGTAFNVSIKDNIEVDLIEVLEGTISDGGTYDPDTQTILWNIGNVAPDEVVERTFTARVKFGEGIDDGDKIDNQVTVENDTTAVVESNIVTSEINCGYLAGTIWEDFNKNAIIEEGEYRIPDVDIVLTVEDFEEYGVTFESNGEGQYVASCLPYEKDIYVDIVRPNGYIGQSTVDNYMIRLSMSGETIIYKLDDQGEVLYVWAGNSFEHADLGLYRTRLASGSVLGVSTMAMSATGVPAIIGLLGATSIAIGLYFGIKNREELKRRLQVVVSSDRMKGIWNRK